MDEAEVMMATLNIEFGEFSTRWGWEEEAPSRVPIVLGSDGELVIVE